MSDVIELHDIEALNDFQSDWTRLLSITPGGTFFRSREWLQVYWKHFAADQKLRVLIVRENGEVTGIVPLCWKKIKSKFGSCRILTFPFDDWGSFYGPVSPDQESTLRAAFHYLLNSPRDWDLIDLRCVETDGFDGGATERAFQAEKMEFEKFVWEQAMYVDLSQSWEEYLAARPRKARQTYTRAERNLQAQGEIEHLRYRPRGEAFGESDPRWDLYEMCELIAAKSWQGSSTTGTTITHANVNQFFRDTYESAIRAGAFDLNLIFLSGEPAAFSYNFVQNGLINGLRMGYNPEVSDQGLGRLLVGRILHDSMDRGDLLLDVGTGAVDAKRYWYTSVENSYRYVYYSSVSPIGNVLRLSHQVASWFRDRFDGTEAGQQQDLQDQKVPAKQH
ncbi:GNAT family N-acetyltransferase [Gimesia sp.]|uniref:GNAT family N-acetyltransferase n=1 Tax=Gimesia sp. TaxID=2024833 RepID=UPI003A951C43